MSKNAKFDAWGSEPQWEIEVEFKNDLDEDTIGDILVGYFDEIIEFESEDIWFKIGDEDEEVRITSFWHDYAGSDSGGLNEWSVEEEEDDDGDPEDSLLRLAELAKEQGKQVEELVGVGPELGAMVREAAGMPPLVLASEAQA